MTSPDLAPPWSLLEYSFADVDLERLFEQLEAHRSRVDQFHAAGTLLLEGPLPESPGGMLAVFTSRAAAEEFLRGDPFVQNGRVQKWSIRDWLEGIERPRGVLLAAMMSKPGRPH